MSSIYSLEKKMKKKNSEVEDPRGCQGTLRVVSNGKWTLTSHSEIGPEDL